MSIERVNSRELEQFEKKNNLPNFIIMLLPNDHTSGTAGSAHTATAVADHDWRWGESLKRSLQAGSGPRPAFWSPRMIRRTALTMWTVTAPSVWSSVLIQNGER
jgi:hypothetical protein